jgi:hypothetical protein
MLNRKYLYVMNITYNLKIKIQNSRTLNIGHTRRRQKTKTKKPTQYVLDTTIRKQAQLTKTRHEPSHKQPEKLVQRYFYCTKYTKYAMQVE